MAENGPSEGERGELELLAPKGKRNDRSLLTEALRRGWQLTPERKRQYFAQLDECIRTADLIDDPVDRAVTVVQCNRILQLEQQAMLKRLDQIEDKKNKQPTQITNNTQINIGIDWAKRAEEQLIAAKARAEAKR